MAAPFHAHREAGYDLSKNPTHEAVLKSDLLSNLLR